MNLREERRARALQRLERQGACAVGGSRQALRPHQGERSLGRHELGAVDQRKAFLGKEAHRLEADAAERLGTVEERALADGLGLTYQGPRQGRRRGGRAGSGGGARPPAPPTEPRAGTSGRTPRFRHSSNSSTVSTRAPELPFAS